MAPRIYVGRFEPSFPGVMIRATSPSDLHSFRLHDRRRHAPTAVLSELGDDAIISDLSRQTVLDHELRHFRDSLLFPFGAAATRSRMHASYNGYQAAMTVKQLRGDANVLPVPLQRWLRMSMAERDAFLLGEGGFDGRDLRPPHLPVVPGDDDVSAFAPGLHEFDEQEGLIVGCRVALADYRFVETLWRSPHAEGEQLLFPAFDAWESAGLICQLAAIERYAGGPLVQRFIDWVERHGPRTYRRGLAALARCLETLRWPPTLRNHLALATWAQMGAYETETWGSSPAIRLSALVSAATLGTRWSEDSSFVDLVNEWDAVAGADSFAALSTATAKFGEFCRGSERMPLLPGEMFTSLADAREQMMAAFLADPDTYVNPFAYLAEESRYPQPCVGLEYPGELGSDWIDVTPADWSPAVGFDASLSLTAMALLSDAVFLPDEKSLHRNGRLAIETMLGLQAIRIIQ